MSEQPRGLIAVAGATGKQGGAVARALLANGWQVRAITRHPRSPAAEALKSAGAKVVQADLEVTESLGDAVDRADGVFSVQNFWTSGYDAEVRQGCNLAKAASLCGVRHFVYSSVGGAERGTGIAHFESKWRIEQFIEELDLPATVLRPVFFMENLLEPALKGMIRRGLISLPLPRNRPLQMIAVADIGAFAALAFGNPDSHVGRRLEIAGDELSPAEMARILGAAVNRRVRYLPMPMMAARLAMGKDMADMFRWFNTGGYRANIPALRERHPGLRTLMEWSAGQDWT